MSLDARYDIGQPIHVGQIATAYEAYQRDLDRKVLLKIVHPQWKNDPELLERFSREGKAAAMVSHHNVVKIFDFGREQGLPYIVLEWIDGGTLKDKLSEGPLPQSEVRKIAVELLKGLAAVHRVHLLHRDVKPDNIMLGADGEARLTDFSLAGLRHSSTLTGHNGIVGSPAYLAPELLTGSSPDPRSDLYSLGVVLIEALTGSNPFQAADPMTSIDLVQRISAPKLSGRLHLDPQLALLIDQLLRKNPDDRPLNAETALALLEVPPESVRNDTTTHSPLAPIQNAYLSRSLSYVLIVSVFTIVLVILLSLGTVSKVDFTSPQVIIPRSGTQLEPIVANNPAVSQAESTIVSSGNHNGSSPIISEDNAQYGWLHLLVAPWGNVFIDGEAYGTTPLETLRLTAGKHRLTIEHPSLPGVDKVVSITAEQPNYLQFDLRAEAAEVFFTAVPWGYLWIDGDSIGLLPRSDPLWLTAGSHTIRIIHPDFSEWVKSVISKPGERSQYRIDLNNGTLIATPIPGGRIDVDE